MKDKRILYVSSEVIPYLPETEISSMSFEAPRMVNKQGGQIRIFMPRYGNINERRHQLHEVIRLSGINLVVNDLDMPLIIKVASIPKERIQVYFIDNEDYFKRKAMLQDEDGNLFSDNDERAIFFAKGVIETVKKLEEKLSHIKTPLTLSIIGCVVNGPGEAALTDVGITGGGKDSNMLYLNGIQKEKLRNDEIISKIVSLVEKKEKDIKNKI